MTTATKNPLISVSELFAFVLNISAVFGLWYTFFALVGQDIMSAMSNGSLNSSALDLKYAAALVIVGIITGMTALNYKGHMDSDAHEGNFLKGSLSVLFILVNAASGILAFPLILLFGVFGAMAMSPVLIAPAVALVASAMWVWLPR